MLASYLKSKYNNDDVIKFYDIVTKGDIYEFISNKMGYKSRDEAKIPFLQYLFKDNRGDVPVQHLVKSLFPELYQIILEEKKMFISQGINLAVHLQRVESNIFIPVADQFPTGCLSVHDSLYCLPGMMDKISNEVKSKMKSNGLENFQIK